MTQQNPIRVAHGCAQSVREEKCFIFSEANLSLGGQNGHVERGRSRVSSYAGRKHKCINAGFTAVIHQPSSDRFHVNKMPPILLTKMGAKKNQKHTVKFKKSQRQEKKRRMRRAFKALMEDRLQERWFGRREEKKPDGTRR